LVVTSNRTKHLFDNFETREAFNQLEENLNIDRQFDIVNDDDVNMESKQFQRLTKERNALDSIKYEASVDAVAENLNMEIMEYE